MLNKAASAKLPVTKFFRRGLFSFLCLLLISCSRAPGVYYEQFLGFGTLIEVKIWGVDEKTGRQAVAAITDDINYMHQTWHAWKPGGLSRINELLSTGETFTLSPSILPLIRDGARLAELSGDRFNPAIGQLIKLWGFAADELPKGPPPDKEAIQRLVDQKPVMRDLVLDGVQLKSTNPAVRLDFGAFAKGYAVDLAIEHLKEMGIANAIVNAGGNLRTIGKHGERAWRVGIRNPRGEGVLGSVDTFADESIVTSGDYERYYEYQGKRYHHILDPHSGYPAQGVTSVTVFDSEAGRADAASTAIFIAGVDKWYEVAKAMGVGGVMVVAADGTIYMTPNLKERIYFDIKPIPQVIYSEPLN
ncbi:MAG: FAD:protein FMN transferase [Gammaproteobacteria bacterium]|nr:FAD:protein FMN transferase [Gammaproteobacteria bacterium]